MRERTSAPITSTVSARSEAMNESAMESAYTKLVQAASVSHATAPGASSSFWTRHAAEAGPLGDPLVGRVHHLLEVEVGDHLLGGVDADTRDRARPSLGLERSKRNRVGARAIAGGDGHRPYASSRSAVFCSRNFHRSAITFMFSSSESGSSTSYLSSMAAMSSTRSSESAAR